MWQFTRGYMRLLGSQWGFSTARPFASSPQSWWSCFSSDLLPIPVTAVVMASWFPKSLDWVDLMVFVVFFDDMKSMNLTKYSFPSRLLSPLLGLILVEILSDTWYVVYMVWTSRWFSDYLIAKQDDSEMIDANQKVNFPCSPQCGLRLWSKMHHCPVIHVLRIQQFLSLFEGIPHVDVPKRFMARAFSTNEHQLADQSPS